MTNQNNLYNILAAFNKATKPEEAATPKQQAKAIYESVESKGSIMGGVKGVEKKLAEAFAKHKIDEMSPKKLDNYRTKARAASRDDATPDDKKIKRITGAQKADKKIMAKTGKYAVDEGKMSELDADLKDSSFSDAEFKAKYKKTKAEMRKSMSAKKEVTEGKVKELSMDLTELTDAEFKKKYSKSKAEMRASMKNKKPVNEREDREDDEHGGGPTPQQNPDKGWKPHNKIKTETKRDPDTTPSEWDDEMDEGIMDEPETTDTETGRIHRAKQGGYGNRYDDSEDLAPPPEQIARGRGRPKKLELELKRRAAAERQAAAASAGQTIGRGRPKKAQPGSPNSAPAGTLGLHKFLFGPAPTTLPGKPGVKHKMADTGTEAGRVAKIRGESVSESARPSNFKGYLAEAVGGEDAFEHILNRYRHEVKQFQAGGDLDNDLYEALFDYYLNAGEMPYGVAKARTGDPFEWVAERFDADLGHESVPEMEEAVDPLTIPAYKRKAAGQEPLSLDQVRAPRADSLSDVRNLGGDTARRDTKALDELARLAGITTNESVSVISGDYDGDGDHDMHDHEVEPEDDAKMNISTNQSSDGTKNVTVTADGAAAVALLDMLKMAGMGGSDAAHEQEAIIVSSGEGECAMDDEIEMEEDYANEPAPQYQSIEKQMSAGDDMNRQKKSFPRAQPGDNPMAVRQESVDPVKSMGRDLMAEYQAMKLRK